MAYFFALLALLLGLTGFLLLLSSRLNKNWTIEDLVLVQASPEELFALIQDWKQWKSWSVWTGAEDSDIRLSYKDADTGVGAVQLWEGRMQAEAEILNTEENSLVDYSFVIDKQRIVLRGTLALSPSNSFQTQLAWRLSVSSVSSENGFFSGFKLYFLRNYFQEAMRQSLKNMAQLFKDSNALEDVQAEDEDPPLP